MFCLRSLTGSPRRSWAAPKHCHPVIPKSARKPGKTGDGRDGDPGGCILRDLLQRGERNVRRSGLGGTVAGIYAAANDCWTRHRNHRDIAQALALRHTQSDGGCKRPALAVGRPDHYIVCSRRHGTEAELALGVSQRLHENAVYATAIRLFQRYDHVAVRDRRLGRTIHYRAADGTWRRTWRHARVPRQQNRLEAELRIVGISTEADDRCAGVKVEIQSLRLEGDGGKNSTRNLAG